jgi:hypothetical protein
MVVSSVALSEEGVPSLQSRIFIAPYNLCPVIMV